MSGERPWFVGLPCRLCGRRVVGKWDGFYCQPVGPRGRLGKPWAEHGSCKEAGKA